MSPDDTFKVAVIGTRGCGKTTFSALLYEAAISLVTRSDDFSVDVDPQSSKFLSESIGLLWDGQFPGATELGKVGRLGLTFRFKGKLIPTWKTIKFDFYDVSGQDVIEFIEKLKQAETGEQIQQLLDEYQNMESLLRSDVYIFLMDGFKLVSPASARKLSLEFAPFLNMVVDYISKIGTKPRGVAVVITKYDILMNAQTWGLPPKSSTIEDHLRERVQNYLKELYAVLSSLKRNYGVPIKITYSYVKTREIGKDENTGEPIYAPKVPLEFSENELIDLIQWFGQLK